MIAGPAFPEFKIIDAKVPLGLHGEILRISIVIQDSLLHDKLQ
jgi:hypothetical protein